MLVAVLAVVSIPFLLMLAMGACMQLVGGSIEELLPQAIGEFEQDSRLGFGLDPGFDSGYEHNPVGEPSNVQASMRSQRQLPEWFIREDALPEWMYDVDELPDWFYDLTEAPVWFYTMPRMPQWFYSITDIPDWFYAAGEVPEVTVPEGGDRIGELSGESGGLIGGQADEIGDEQVAGFSAEQAAAPPAEAGDSNVEGGDSGLALPDGWEWPEGVQPPGGWDPSQWMAASDAPGDVGLPEGFVNTPLPQPGLDNVAAPADILEIPGFSENAVIGAEPGVSENALDSNAVAGGDDAFYTEPPSGSSTAAIWFIIIAVLLLATLAIYLIRSKQKERIR